MVCDKDRGQKEDFLAHMETHSEELKSYRFSNSASDCCKTLCKICGQGFPLTTMRQHTKSKHGMVITDYKTKFEQTFYDMVEKVFHRCGICGLAILMDSDAVSSHLGSNKATHQISHKQYNEIYLNKTYNMAREKDPVLKAHGPQTQTASRPPLTQIENRGNLTTDAPNKNSLLPVSIPKQMHTRQIPSHIAVSVVPKIPAKAILAKGSSEPPKLKVKSLEDLMAPATKPFDKVITEMTEKNDVDDSMEIGAESDRTDNTEESSLDNKDPLAQSQQTELAMAKDAPADSILRFRSFLSSITGPGETAPSFPAIEKILEMDTSSEEAILEAVMEYCQMDGHLQ